MSVRILGLTLLHFLWQGGVIGLVAALALRSRARRSAHERYLICVAALLACAVAPCVTAVVLANLPAASLIPRPDAAGLLPLGRLAMPVHQVAASYSLDLPSVAVALWLVGVLAVGTYYAMQWCSVHRIRRHAFSFGASGDLARAGRRLLARWLPDAQVRVMLSHAITTPIVVGVWRPMILFPAATLARLPVEDFELILLHEIGHIVRRDTWVNALQVCLEVVFFYHPVMHWLSHRARLERECACDDFAVAASGSAYRYAQALTSLALAGHRVPAGALGAAGADLLPRLRYLAGECTDHNAFSRNPLPFVLLVALLCCLLVVTPLGRWGELARSPFAEQVFKPAVRPADERTRSPEAIATPLSEAQPQTHIQALERLAAMERARVQPERDAPSLSTVTESELTAPAVQDELIEAPEQPMLLTSEPVFLPDSSIVEPAPQVPTPITAPAPEPGLLATYSPLPDYPARARLDGIEGTVSVVLRVSPDGRPAGLQIVRAEPLGVFEGAVRRALMRWRFDVSGTSSAPSDRTVAYDLRFALGGVSSNAAPVCAPSTASHICRSF
jgi:TonB family protein